MKGEKRKIPIMVVLKPCQELEFEACPNLKPLRKRCIERGCIVFEPSDPYFYPCISVTGLTFWFVRNYQVLFFSTYGFCSS